MALLSFLYSGMDPAE